MTVPTIYVNLSYRHMKAEELDFLAVQGLQPELYFSGEDIDSAAPDAFATLQGDIESRKFRPIWHAPFFDLNLGAHDPKIRSVSLERLVWSIDTAKRFGADQIVVHPGFGPYVLGKNFAHWFDRARPALDTVISHAEKAGLRIAFENIYDACPDDLAALIEPYPEKVAGVCFDTGHFNLFSQTAMKMWLERFGNRLFECHLHDNLGSEDDHIAVEDGTVKYGPLVSWLNAREPATRPRLTLEMEQKTHVIKSVTRVKNWFAGPIETL